MGFPSTIKTFINKTDNVDEIKAVDINDVQTEITAIETELGTNPKGLAASVKERIEDIEESAITNLTGDVSASGPGSVAATIANKAVTLAKMADMATASLLGRNSAGLGTPEVLSIATVQSILGIADGWISDSKTWTYASATTFTISGNYVTQFPIGTKIKLTQTSVKYFYVVAVSYSAPNTTVTVAAGSDYSLANAAITLPYYSYVSSPQGFPQWFNYTPVAYGLTTPSYTIQTGQFCIVGRAVKVKIYLDIQSWAAQTGYIRVTLPTTQYNSYLFGTGSYYRAGGSTNAGIICTIVVTGYYGAFFNADASDAANWEASSRVVIQGAWEYNI